MSKIRAHSGKFLLVGDIHANSLNYSTRVDSISATVLSKLTYVLNLARGMNADIICTGDFFHLVDQSVPFMNSIIDLLHQYSDVTFYCIYGNHDLHYKSMDYVDQSPLTTLVHASVIHPLDASPVTVLNDASVTIGYLYGHSYGTPLPKISTPAGVPSLLVTHHFIDNGFEASTIVKSEDLKDFTYVLGGHDHTPFKTLITPTTTIIRPGSLMRTENSKLNRERSIYVYSLDLVTGVLEQHIVPATSGNDVFSFYSQNKAEDQRKDGTFDEVMSLLDSQVANAENSISTIVSKLPLQPELKDRVIELLHLNGVAVNENIKEDLI